MTHKRRTSPKGKSLRRRRRGRARRGALDSLSTLALALRGNGALAVAYSQTTVPLREWDRATQFLSTFAVSGFLAEKNADGAIVPLRPASVILVGGPGSGKTELVQRFAQSSWMSFHSDLTVRSLLPLLARADRGQLTHVAAPEFNKWFQRKSFVAENCVGLLCSAMEEGVKLYSVGGEERHFNGARLGLFAGMTPRTMTRRREMLADMGFLSRICALEWALPEAERIEITRRMNVGIADDLDTIVIPVPDIEHRPVVIGWDVKLGETVVAFTREHWPQNDLRTFRRFKTLLLARAYLTGRTKVTGDEWDWLRTYDDYWQRLIVGED